MVKTFAPFAASVAVLLAAATAASLPDGSWPASTGTVQYSEAYTVKAGEVFDGKMQTFERSDISCEGQTESGSSTAVFLVEAGGTLKNVIIGKNQMEGVHCDKHDCTIDNVWWDDVCEDALSIKGGTASSVSTVTGGGARYADDKVIQHNGFGTVNIDGFYGEDISKLYRSCGTCGDKARKVSVSNVYVVNPGNAVVTVNKNWGDEATLSNIWVKSSKSTVKICQWSQGNANGEPKILGNGPSPPLCQYAESDVHINEDISTAVQTAASLASSSSGVTQTHFSASIGSSVASSASVASSSEEDPTQATSSSSLASSASASSQASSNSSSSDSSDATGPGTVSPMESGSFEQSVVSTDASQTEQEQSTDAPSVSTSSSGSLYSSSDDISQTAVQQSSVASSSATDTPQTNVVLECDSSSGSSTEQGDVTSQPSSVASSSANDNSQTNVVLECDSSSGSSAEQIELPTQESTAASTSSGSDNAAQNEDQIVQFSTSSSTAASASVASSSSSEIEPIEQSSGSDSTTQNSGSDFPTTTQASSSSSITESSGSDSPTQSATNSSGSVPDGTWPASTGTVLYSKPYTIKAGEVFDGKMQTFERSDITCTGGEGQKDSAVFLVEAGGTLKNAIIGKNQKEGVHCDDHDCTIENVWWDDVCEDALSIKGGSASSVTTVTNCGARYAEDKVVQHNGYGTVKIKGFFAQEFGKLYRSCGTCGNIPRTVTVEDVYAIDPLVSVITVNKNYGDKATLKNIYVKTTDGKDDVKVCQWSKGSKTPSNLGDGPSGTLCQYTTSDVHINDE